MAKTKTWKIDAGNSSTGQIGFCAYGIKADTKEAALDKIKKLFPDQLEDTYDMDDREPITICTYFNTNALTLDNIEEDEDADDSDEDEL